MNHWGGGFLEHTFPNPLPPCHFECFGNGPDEDRTARFRPPAGLRQKQDLYETFMEVAAFSQCKMDFRDEATAEAHLLCLRKGYSGAPAARAKAAREALKLSPHCAEAYNVLALSDAKTLDEALEQFQCAASTVSAAPAAWCTCVGSTDGCHKPSSCPFRVRGRLFEYQGPGRAHFRAMHGIAATLLKLGRGAESLKHYRQLQLVDNAWGTQGAMSFGEVYRSPSYLIYHPQVAQAMLMAGETAQALKFLLESEQAVSLFDRVSSVMQSLASLAFCDYKLNGPGCRINEFVRMKKQGQGAEGPIPLEMAVCFLGSWHPILLDYISGEVELPRRRIPQTYHLPSLLSGATCDEYASYALYNGPLWRQTPGALEWAIKHRNTYCCAIAISIAVSKARTKDANALRQRAPGSERLAGTTWGTFEREVFWGETKEIGWDYARPGDDADDSDRSKTRQFLESFEFFQQRVSGGVFLDRLSANCVPDEGFWDGCLLSMACRGGNELSKYIQVLLKAGFDPNARTAQGNTCMLVDSYALADDKTEVFEWLLAFGGDYNALNPKGDGLSCLQKGFRAGKARYVETLLAVHLEHLMHSFGGVTPKSVEAPRQCRRSLGLYGGVTDPKDQVRVFLCTTLRDFVLNVLKPVIKFGLMHPESLRKDLKRCLEVLGRFGYSANTHKQALQQGDDTEINAHIRHILSHQVHEHNSGPLGNVANLRPRLPDTGLDFYPEHAVKFLDDGSVVGILEDHFSEEEAINILQRIIKHRKAAANHFFKLNECELSASIYVRLSSLIKKILLPLHCCQKAVTSAEVDTIFLLRDFAPTDTGILPDLLKELSILYSNRAACCLSLKDYALAQSTACSSIEANPLFFKSWVRLSKAYLGLADSASVLWAAQSATIALKLAFGSANDAQLRSIAAVMKEISANILAEQQHDNACVQLVHCVASTDTLKSSPEVIRALRAALDCIHAGLTRQEDAENAAPRRVVFEWLDEHNFGLVLESDSDSETGCDAHPVPSFNKMFTTEQLCEWIGKSDCLTEVEAFAVRDEIASSEFDGSDFVLFNVKILRRVLKGTEAEGAEMRLLAYRDKYGDCPVGISPEPIHQQSTFARIPEEALLLICASLTRVDRVNFAATHPNVRRLLFSEAAVPLWAGVLNLQLAGTRLVMDGGGWRRKDRCFQCGRSDVELKRCARCKSAWFCGTECYTQSWACGHDVACTTISRQDGCRMCGKSVHYCRCSVGHIAAECVERQMADEREQREVPATTAPRRVNGLSDRWLCSLPVKFRQTVMSSVTRLVIGGTISLMVGAGPLVAAGVWPAVTSLSLFCTGGHAYVDSGTGNFAMAQFLSQLTSLSNNLCCLESIAFEEGDDFGFNSGCSVSLDSVDRPLNLNRLLEAFPRLTKLRYPTDDRGPSIASERDASDSSRSTWVPHPEFHRHCKQAELSRIKAFYLHPTFNNSGLFGEGQQQCLRWVRESVLHLPHLETLRLRFDTSCGDPFEFLLAVASISDKLVSIFLEIHCDDGYDPCVVQRATALRCLGLLSSRAPSLSHVYIRFDTRWQLRGYRGPKVQKLEPLDFRVWSEDEDEDAEEFEPGCGWQPNKLAGNEAFGQRDVVQEPEAVLVTRFSLWSKFCADIYQCTDVEVMVQPCEPVDEEIHQTYCKIVSSKQEPDGASKLAGHTPNGILSRTLASLPRSGVTSVPSTFESDWAQALHGEHADATDKCTLLHNTLTQQSRTKDIAHRRRLQRVERATSPQPDSGQRHR